MRKSRDKRTGKNGLDSDKPLLRLVSNNFIAAILVIVMVIQILSTLLVYTQEPVTANLASLSTASGTANLCVNTRPSLDISGCNTSMYVGQDYYCVINATDRDANYSLMLFSFYDNTSIFNVTKLYQSGNFSEAEISFSAVNNHTYGQDFWAHQILITVSDNSQCSNENDTAVLTINITKGCGSKAAPSFSNLSTSYNLSRLRTHYISVNYTDVDLDDVNISIIEESYTCGFKGNCSLGSLSSSYWNLSELLLTLSPEIQHIGHHIVNFTLIDDSGCIGGTSTVIVNLTIWPDNTAPVYVGEPSELDMTWDEDTSIYPYFLDEYFSDGDGDCLNYVVEYMDSSDISTPENIYVWIDNNQDPRISCSISHLVKLNATPNWFGTEQICFRANDTIDVSLAACFNFTVNNVPEVVSIAGTPEASGAPGGGGGGPLIGLKRCEEQWQCKQWGTCNEGVSFRNCTDINRCGTSKFKPNISMDCVVRGHCFDGVQNYGEQGVDCGGDCTSECVTCFDGIMNCHVNEDGNESCELGIDCGGPCKECGEDEIIETPEQIEERLAPRRESRLIYYILISLGILALIAGLIFAILNRKNLKRNVQKSVREFRADMKKLKKKRRAKEKEKKAKKKDKKLSVLKSVEKVLPHIEINAESRIDGLMRQVGKKDNNEILVELGKVMRQWLKQETNTEHVVSYDDAEKLVGARHLDRVKPLFDALQEIEYSGASVSDVDIKKLLVKAKSTVKIKLAKRKVKTIVPVVLITFLLLSGMFAFLQPDITGMFVQDISKNVDIGMNFSTDGYYNLDDTGLSSLKLSGSMGYGTIAKVYVRDGFENVLVMDTELLHSPLITRTDQIRDTNSGKVIDLKIGYKEGTQWDTDDDGVVMEDEAIDISVDDTLFGWDADESKLCTLWEVKNEEGRGAECYGSLVCCNLLEMQPSRDSWQDTLYLTKGSLGAGTSNIVSARVIFANYSVDEGDAYSDIIESEIENISANFMPYSFDFSEACVESCNLPEMDSYDISVEVDSGWLYLDEATIGKSVSVNNVPVFEDIPAITIMKNGEYELDLSELVTDADGDQLIYSYYPMQEVSVNINGGIATIVPRKGFTGKVYTYFTANDSEDMGVSNLVEIDVVDKKEAAIQGAAKIGSPVKWTKIVELNASREVVLEHTPINISVSRINGDIKERTENVRVKKDGKMSGIQDYGKPKGFVKRAASSLPRDPENLTLVIDDQADEVEIEYFTEAPVSTEEEISSSMKRVVISSDTHYQEITAFTTLDDVPLSSIKLYHVVNETRKTVDFDPYDRNGDGNVDYIEWIVPHLSNQTYEVEITVLNVQSYPTVGGEWEVRFTTVGMANLTMSAISDTSYGETLPDDLTPLELRCGEEQLNFEWSSLSNNAYYDDYECNDTGYWTVRVMTPGVHNQMFTFGDAVAYANNYASVNGSESNLTIWDTIDEEGGVKYATDIVTFFANFSNGSQIISGNCTIKFNFSGVDGWQNQTLMTYNGPSMPWNITRNITYKGMNYYNVRCVNGSKDLNVTTNITITNTPPTIHELGTIEVDEDSPYTIQLSNNVSDPDTIESFNYTREDSPNLPENLFTLDRETGEMTILSTLSSDAGSYNILIIVKDSDIASDSSTLYVDITAVNDYPYFVGLDKPLDPSALTEHYYTYDVDGNDEESGTNLIYNMSIVNCSKSFAGPVDCMNLNFSINTTNGLIYGTPQSTGYAGNYTFNLTLKDEAGYIQWNITTLTILDNNSAPSLDFVCDNKRGAIEDILFNCTINATDPESDVLNFEANLSWFDTYLYTISSNEVLFNHTPTNQQVGNYTINISVYDGVKGALGTLSDSRIINFTVNNTNDVPTINSLPDQTAIIGVIFTYIVNAFDWDFWQPYNSYTEENENLTFGVNVTWVNFTKYNATAAILNFTANESQKGTYTLLLNVSDILGNSSNQTINITIRNNTAPILGWICNNSRTIQENRTHVCFLNATDPENDSFTFGGNESWFRINASNGSVSFMVNDTYVGDHWINFTVTDIWGWSSSSVVNFTVNNTPEAPVIYGARNLTAREDQLFTYDFSKNVSDEDSVIPGGDPLRYYINYSLPSGNLDINITTGFINFTPIGIDVGSYEINITVNDSFNLTASIILNISVNQTNDPPVLDYVCNNSRNATEDILFTCVINATDDEGDTLTFASNVSWFNISSTGVNTAIANFTPTNSEVGMHSILINVTDGTTLDYTVIQFAVNNTNDAPYFNPSVPNMTATEDTAFYYDINATDDDQSTYLNDTLTFASNSTIFTIGSSTGVISFTPNNTINGTYWIRFNVTDLAGAFNETVINFTVLAFNDPPNLSFIPNQVIEENDLFYWDVNATDEEDYNDSTGRLIYSWNHTRGWFYLNYTTGVINFTANITMNGTHTINLSVNDTGGKVDWQLFNITINEGNEKPNITAIYPYGSGSATIFAFASKSDYPNNITSVNAAENSTVLFNHTSNDPNGDSLNYTWYRDGMINATSSSLTHHYYAFDFDDEGMHNLTLVVEDSRGTKDNFTWNISVNNTNRLPIFGLIEHDTYSEFSSGTKSNSNVTINGVILAKIGANYAASGVFTSASIDMGALVSSFYNPIGLVNISWTENLPAGTDAAMQTRTSSNNIAWGNWSDIDLGSNYTDNSGETIVSANQTYLQYRILLSTTDTSTTPNVSAVRIRHVIPSITLDQGSSNANWLDLDNYFTDPDLDVINFTVTGDDDVTITINNQSHAVALETDRSFAGTNVVRFIANDSHGAASSNNVSIVVESSPTTSSVEYIYVSSTRTVYKTRTRTLTEPRYLEVVAPKHINAFSPDTVVAPITIKNNGDSMLTGLDLRANPSTDLVDVWFSQDRFESIAPGQSTEVEMFMKWNGTLDEFDVVVNATSVEPEFSDAAIISVTGVARVENNRSIQESYIEFVRDLLNNNPECLELTELLNEAESALGRGEVGTAKNRLNFVIEGCRYLLSTQNGIEQPVPIEPRDTDLFKLISGVLLLLLFIATVIIIALFAARRRL